MAGVTNAFNGNYTIPVELTILSLVSTTSPIQYEIGTSFLKSQKADRINTSLMPGDPTASGYLDPLRLAFRDQIGAVMEKAIFPSFFHGKCQDAVTGINPAGCPNPDCPVVCGTPGSMVHYYSRLRYIAYNTTWHLMHELARPGTPTFTEIQNNVEAIRNGARRRRLSLDPRGSALLKPPMSPGFSGGLVSRAIITRDNYVRDSLARIFQDIRPNLEKICGGVGDGTTNGLPYCSWEQVMKEYILTFP
jgi:hypothetical protein